MVRMTITIDERLVQEAKDLLGVSTKAEAIRVALEDFLRRKRLEQVLQNQGKVKIDLDQDSLQKYREEE